MTHPCWRHPSRGVDESCGLMHKQCKLYWNIVEIIGTLLKSMLAPDEFQMASDDPRWFQIAPAYSRQHQIDPDASRVMGGSQDQIPFSYDLVIILKPEPKKPQQNQYICSKTQENLRKTNNSEPRTKKTLVKPMYLHQDLRKPKENQNKQKRH